MQFHPFANDYPLMEEGALQVLAATMQDVGFDKRFAIVRFQGQILDGRNRFRAAEIAKVDPFFVDFLGTEDEARRFVEYANECRRHLEPSWLSEHRRARVERIAAARRAGHSTRAIAEAEGISVAQAGRDLARCTVLPGTPDAPALCLRCSMVGVAACDSCKAKGAKAEKNGQRTVTGTDGKKYAAVGRKPKTKRTGPKPFTFKAMKADFGRVVRNLDDMIDLCTERAGNGQKQFNGHKASLSRVRPLLEQVHEACMSAGQALSPRVAS